MTRGRRRRRPGSRSASASRRPRPRPTPTSPSAASISPTCWPVRVPVSSRSTSSGPWLIRRHPRPDGALREQAQECSVRQLADLAVSAAGVSEERAAAEHDGRFVRFNDRHRTMTAQLPAESYAEVRSTLEARAREIPSDGETPWDHRLCDALLTTIRTPGNGSPSSNRPLVVAHVPMDALLDDSGEPSALGGELERGGLISVETVQRISCDAAHRHCRRRRRGPHDVRGSDPA